MYIGNYPKGSTGVFMKNDKNVKCLTEAGSASYNSEKIANYKEFFRELYSGEYLLELKNEEIELQSEEQDSNGASFIRM